jgi:hypothetical protein
LSNIDTRGAKEAALLDLAGLSRPGKIHLGIQRRDVKTQPRIAFKVVKVTLFVCMPAGNDGRRPRNATALGS